MMSLTPNSERAVFRLLDGRGEHLDQAQLDVDDLGTAGIVTGQSHLI